MSEIHLKIMSFFGQHIIFANLTHLAAGFGIAVLLQYYKKGNSFVPPLIGWVCVAFAAVAHLIAFFS
ncbi:MAG TPA: hypothetical protein VHO47_05180 [Candidatus Babeliales bacterium]|nr:hypothetical protein [Candidatus Babeliales bacterium]